ncbi:tyrosinase [Panaeolus papilionaceus]|nr:tyrosinase [Panaeolus papilionaceus]
MLHLTSLLSYIFISLSVLGQVIAHQSGSDSSSHRHDPNCHIVYVRREWRILTTKEKAEYTNAVLCLQNRPAANLQDKVARTRFDEFQGLHVKLADQVHSVGHFLPWHRYFLMRYELALREECGYKGAHPYWDWSIDADAPLPLIHSPIFDPHTGFGGDGIGGTYSVPADPKGESSIFPEAFRGCVTDGPFANLRLNYGPGKYAGDHCLTRGIDNTLKGVLNSTAVSKALSQPNFGVFRIEVEGQPETSTPRIHDGGHIAIGGEMSNIYSSPGDPLFFMHHANLDRIWRKWQLSKPGRMWEVSGRSTPTPPPFVNVTVEFPLNMGTLGDTIPIREIMDTASRPGCYTYT